MKYEMKIMALNIEMKQWQSNAVASENQWRNKW